MAAGMKRSLRNRLLRYLSLPLLLGLLAIGAGSYYSARLEAGKIYDAQLVHFARVLHELTRREIASGNGGAPGLPRVAAALPGSVAYEKNLGYRVWVGDRLLLQSSGALMPGHKTHQRGFTDRRSQGAPIRMFMLRQGDITIEVAENHTVRTDLMHHMALSILVPFFFVIPLLAGAVWWGLRIGLKPLNTVSSAVAGMNPSALEPLNVAVTLPRELAPFVESINQLMARVEAVIEREKRFTGYAAHELRTPLAALKTQLQVARRERDASERAQIYADAVAGVDRMTHLVNQLLLLLRSQKGGEALAPLDLSALVRQAMEDSTPAMLARTQHFSCMVAPDVTLPGNADMLRVMLRNLLDNASRYSPPGATIHLTLARDENAACLLRVHNSGVQLGAEECLHIFEPFYRGRQQAQRGAGIGLAIVSWVARMHGFSLSAAMEEDGLAITLRTTQ